MPKITIPALIVLIALAACNTVAGMGRDLRSAGDATERAAERR
jgi:predicted small secreted protein